MSKKCPTENCAQHGSSFSAFNFCPSCGAEMIEQGKCKCGKEYIGSLPFCVNCGKKREDV